MDSFASHGNGFGGYPTRETCEGHLQNWWFPLLDASLFRGGRVFPPDSWEAADQSRYSCFTQSTSITHSPLIGESVILAKFRIANMGSG